MKHPFRTLSLLALPLLLLGATVVRQDDRPERDLSQLTEQDKQRLMMEAMALAAPGPEHELLARFTGEKDLEIEMWMAPGMKPMKVQSQGHGEMVLGGRFLMTRSKGKFFGMETETLNMIGFDRRSKEFTITAFDTMGTYSVSARGGWVEEGVRAVLHGTDYDAHGQFTQVYDFVLTFGEDGTMTTEIVFHDEVHAPGDEPFTMVRVQARKK